MIAVLSRCWSSIDALTSLLVSQSMHPVVQEATCSSPESNEIPVSAVDLDVPVTAIDEVLEEYEQSEAEQRRAQPQTAPAGHHSTQQPGDVGRNRNNNAGSSCGHNQASGAQTGPLHVPRSEPRTQAHSAEKEKPAPGTTTKPQLQRQKATADADPNPGSSRKLHGLENGPSSLPSSHSQTAEKAEGGLAYRSHSSSSKITHSPVSRFGMRTFTVVPPKPTVAPTPAPTAPTTGAIKIDELGNMVRVDLPRNKFGGSSESGINVESPLLGRAKAFWSSTEKQDAAALVPGRGSSMRAREKTEGDQKTSLVTAASGAAGGVRLEERTDEIGRASGRERV